MKGIISEGCRQREGVLGYNILSAFSSNFLNPTVPSALCHSPMGLSEEIISEHGQYETDGRMMDLTQ